jgi:hypothetical protein
MDAIPQTAAVPAHYRGLWRRSSLTTPTRCDTTTQVYWLQTEHWHADLRIPADRPSFAGVRNLRDCDNTQLRWLLTQGGFAGVTRVVGAECEWLRQLDYRPPSGERDIGRMVFHPGRVEEIGIEDDYHEWWEAEAAGAGDTRVALEHDAAGELRGVQVTAGQRFIRCRPRRIDQATELALWAAVRAGSADRAVMLALADFELSLGEGNGGEGKVLLSTLPWLESEC